MKKHDKYEQARELRRQGYSLNEIARRVGAAKSTVSGWVRDIELTEEQQANLKEIQYASTFMLGAQANHDKALAQREAYQQAGRDKAKSGSRLHLMGCMLYWAEGAKDRNKVRFTNSDVNMMLLFMRFLREELLVPDEKFSIQIHCHTHDEHEIYQIEQYWLDLLHLTRDVLIKTYIKEGSTSRKNRLENGVCSLYVHSTELAQHIFGAIQEYGGFDNPDWLY